VRSGPSTTYPSIYVVSASNPLHVIGQAYACAWLKVTTADKREGWVLAQYITLNLDCARILQAPIPATPTVAQLPTATPGLELQPTPTLRPTATATLTATVMPTLALQATLRPTPMPPTPTKKPVSRQRPTPWPTRRLVQPPIRQPTLESQQAPRSTDIPLVITTVPPTRESILVLPTPIPTLVPRQVPRPTDIPLVIPRILTPLEPQSLPRPTETPLPAPPP
jgi:hypothetical protein